MGGCCAGRGHPKIEKASRGNWLKRFPLDPSEPTPEPMATPFLDVQRSRFKFFAHPLAGSLNACQIRCSTPFLFLTAVVVTAQHLCLAFLVHAHPLFLRHEQQWSPALWMTTIPEHGSGATRCDDLAHALFPSQQLGINSHPGQDILVSQHILGILCRGRRKSGVSGGRYGYCVIH